MMGMVASAAVMVMGALPTFAAEGGLTVGMTPPTGDNLLMTAGVIVGVALVAAVVWLPNRCLIILEPSSISSWLKNDERLDVFAWEWEARAFAKLVAVELLLA